MKASVLRAFVPFTSSDLDSNKMHILCGVCNFLFCSSAIISIVVMGIFRVGHLGHIASAFTGLSIYCMAGLLIQFLRIAKIEEREREISSIYQQVFPIEDRVESLSDSRDKAQKTIEDIAAGIEALKEQMNHNQDNALSKQDFQDALSLVSTPLNKLIETVNIFQNEVCQLEKERPGRMTLQDGESPFADKIVKKEFKQYMSSINPMTLNSVKGRGLIKAMMDLNTQHSFMKACVSEQSFSRWMLIEYSSKFSPGRRTKTVLESSLKTAQNYEESKDYYLEELKKQFGYK